MNIIESKWFWNFSYYYTARDLIVHTKRWKKLCQFPIIFCPKQFSVLTIYTYYIHHLRLIHFEIYTTEPTFLYMYKFWYLNQNVAIKDNLDAKKNSTWRREKIQKFKIWIIVALKCQLFFIISLKTWSISILYDAKPRASNINIHIHIFCWLLTPKLFDIAAL